MVHLYEADTPGYAQAEEVSQTALRFGIFHTDIRTTGRGVWAAAQQLTGVDWESAADPCPWRALSEGKGRRVYLNPPFSRVDSWLAKAAEERRNGVEVLAVVPHTWA
eukprot:gene13983-13625_t